MASRIPPRTVPVPPVALIAVVVSLAPLAGCAVALIGGAAAGGAVAGTAAADKERDAGDVVSDASITTRVKSALAVNGTTKALAIDVDTRNGVVTLYGKVRSQAEMDEAVRVAAGVKGVRSVVNRLALRSD